MTGYQDVDGGEISPLLPAHEPASRSIRRSKCCCCTILSLVTLLLIFFSGLAVVFTSPAPRSTSKDFPSNGPGIGLALLTHGGRVAIRNKNGSIDNVARIKASQDYVGLL